VRLRVVGSQPPPNQQQLPLPSTNTATSPTSSRMDEPYSHSDETMRTYCSAGFRMLANSADESFEPLNVTRSHIDSRICSVKSTALRLPRSPSQALVTSAVFNFRNPRRFEQFAMLIYGIGLNIGRRTLDIQDIKLMVSRAVGLAIPHSPTCAVLFSQACCHHYWSTVYICKSTPKLKPT
jgi:hypothetical protein